ncbi:MAG: nickel-dependent hydrogenase large subunit [Rhodopseudomonas sp.]|uniref:nickel-dependent hydrogenase large subunit n=1 Tax=Rhodopseudomonas sp. TaxID=1078 RepID=UPI0018229E57|nr:nickel-dependent hydrogenase large subunit [Rhodopseudomonas sp.]NVN85480.1 nickel-dependent hydrogenase large subunit [Rhodopseudomonas sp.]
MTTASADIAIALDLIDGRVAGVDITPRRLPPIDAMMAGRPVAEMMAVLPRLFALCSTAHAVAATTAVDAARGIEPSPAQQRQRHAAVLAERLVEQLRSAVTKLRLLDRPPVAHATRQAIGAAAQFGLSANSDVPTLLRAIDQIEAALNAIHIADLQPAESTARFGSSGPLALTAADDLNVIARLLQGGTRYAAAPDLDGAIPETGAWARSRASTAPDTAAARLRARLDELATMPQTLRALVSGDAPCPDAPIGYRVGNRRGAAAVETARGRLYHLVELGSDGRVAAFQMVAPTEWNFHPRGPLAQMLRHAALGADADAAAGQLIAAFDPCVGCKLSIREAADA